MSSPVPTPEARSERPWFAVGIGAGLLAAETILLERTAGDTILQLATDFFVRRPYRKEIVMAAALAALVVVVRAWDRPAPYRNARVSVGRIALQAALGFLPLLAFATWVGGGSAVPGLSDVAVPRVAMALVGLWLVSLPLLVPVGAPVGTVAGSALATVGVVTTAIVSAEVFWNLTGEPTLRLVSWMLESIAGVEPVRPEPGVIGVGDFRVSVGFGCSGYQGIGLIAALLGGYMWWFRAVLRFPRTLFLIPIGMVLSYLANAVRITALILIGVWVSPQIAVDGFHSNAGWLAFLMIGLGMIWITSRLPFFANPEAVTATAVAAPAGGGPEAAPTSAAPTVPGEWFGPSTVACLLPFLALLASTLVAGAFSAHGALDLLYPVRVMVVVAVLWSLRASYGEVSFDPSPLSIALGAAVFALWMVLAPNVTDPDPEAAARLDPSSLGPVLGAAWVVVRFLGYTVTVPIAEELAFRGFLARRLVSDDPERVPLGTFTWLSFLGSSLAFGLLHQSQWFPGTIAGMAYAAALCHRRRIGDAIAAHATTNALLGTYVIATGSWASWG